MSTKNVASATCNVAFMSATLNVAMAETEEERMWREFGLWLKQQRESLGLSQEGAGDKIGMTRQQWQRLESGQSTKRSTVRRIAIALKIDPQIALDKAGFKTPDEERYNPLLMMARPRSENKEGGFHDLTVEPPPDKILLSAGLKPREPDVLTRLPFLNKKLSRARQEEFRIIFEMIERDMKRAVEEEQNSNDNTE